MAPKIDTHYLVNEGLTYACSVFLQLLFFLFSLVDFVCLFVIYYFEKLSIIWCFQVFPILLGVGVVVTSAVIYFYFNKKTKFGGKFYLVVFVEVG